MAKHSGRHTFTGLETVVLPVQQRGFLPKRPFGRENADASMF